MPSLRNIVRTLNIVMLGLALCAEPIFMFLAAFCGDSPHYSAAEIYACTGIMAFLPLLATAPFIAGSFFLLRRGRNKSALLLSCVPVIEVLALAWWLQTA